MNHLKLTLTALLTAALVVASLPLQVFAQASAPNRQRLGFTNILQIGKPGDEPKTVTTFYYDEIFKDDRNWFNKKHFNLLQQSYRSALDSGAWAIVQSESNGHKSVVLYWIEDFSDSEKVTVYALGSGSETRYAFQPPSDKCFRYVTLSSDNKVYVATNYAGQPTCAQMSIYPSSERLFLYSGNYQLHESAEGLVGHIPKTNSLVQPEIISPNFTIEVKNRTIQVQHIKEFDRLPGYENDKPVVEAFLKKCNKVVTSKDFNPNALNHEALENVFGFVKMATDPLVDVGNFVVTKISPNSPELGKIPERERDRILWCSEPEIVKTDYVDLGSLLRYEIADYSYYLISLKYLTEHRHSYNSTITPDYVYYQTPDSNDKYDYDPREVVFNADGKTFSNDTRNLSCDAAGFCEIPPDEKDCSYGAQGSWAKVVSCHIGNFMTGLGNFMKWLFIPDSLSVYNSFNTVLDSLKKSFGFLWTPVSFIKSVYQGILDNQVSGNTCVLPPLTIFGSTATVHLCQWRYQLPGLWRYMQIAIQAGLLIGFIWALYRSLMSFFGARVDDHDESDDEYEEVRWHDDRTGQSGSWERRRK